MKHRYFEVEVQTDVGEFFFLDVTINVISAPIHAKIHGPPEHCRDGEAGIYEIEWCLSEEHHPTLRAITIPELDAVLEKAANKWADREIERMWGRR